MKRFSKTFIALMLSFTTLGMISCGNDESKKSDASDNKISSSDKHEISGTVDYALPTAWLSGKEERLNAFSEVYPNVKVNIVPYDSDTDTYLTTQAASGELPDIVEGWTGLIYPLSNGLIEPLDEYMEKDEDIQKNVPKNIVEHFRVDGKIYSVPSHIVTTGILVNLDLLDSLNLDRPSYDWTLEEFAELAKKATSNKYSGITNFGRSLTSAFMGMFNKDVVEYGYNPETEKCDFTSGAFVKQLNFMKDLESVPGLLANRLTNQTLRDEGKEDDYQKKFGKEVDAFNDGKILFKPVGTWDLDNLKVNFEYDFYPLPQDPQVGYRQNAAISDLYMLKTAEDKEAAYELLKWMSYGEEGILKAFEIRAGVENPIPRIFLPSTQATSIVEKIKQQDIPEGLKFIYENMDKAYATKENVVPGLFKVNDEIIQPQISKILKGEADAAAVANEMEKRANEILEESWKTLREGLNK